MCLSLMMAIYKQHRSNTGSSIHEKFKQYWGWVETKCYLRIEKSVFVILKDDLTK